MIERREPFGARKIVRGIDVEERITRLRRPLRNGDAMARRELSDAAIVFDAQRAAHIVPQCDGPQRDGVMPAAT